MKNLLLRKELVESNIRLYEAAEKLNVSMSALRSWMQSEWPTELQIEFAEFFKGNSDISAFELRRKLAVFRARSYAGMNDAGGYAARVMAEVQEWELRREKEREGWY